jgi:hypothetical protein
MVISLTAEELIYLMGINAIPFTTRSPFNFMFDYFLRVSGKKDIDQATVMQSLMQKGYVASSESLKPTQDVQCRIEMAAVPDTLYSVTARCYNKVHFAEFYEKNGEILEFSISNGTCYMKEPIGRARFTEDIASIPGKGEENAFHPIKLSIPEYVVLSAAFQLQSAFEHIGHLPALGSGLHYGISDIRDEIQENPKLDIIDVFADLGSGYEHSMILRDPEQLRKIVLDLIARGLLAWINPSLTTITIGPSAKKLYALTRKPSRSFMTISGFNFKSVDWTHTVSLLWSDNALIKIAFNSDTISFIGMTKENLKGIIKREILYPVPKLPTIVETPSEEPEVTEKMLKFCPKCGWKNERSAAFCPKCGKSLKKS